MNDRARAEELLSQAWQCRPAYELERVEILLAALTHAVLASGGAPAQPSGDDVAGQWEDPEPLVLASALGTSAA